MKMENGTKQALIPLDNYSKLLIMSVNVAPVKWAQRKDSLFVTISLPDVTNHEIKVTDKQLTFK